MVIIGACPLPDMDDLALCQLCVAMEARLKICLDAAQLAHVRGFAPTGAPLRARAGRLLCRLMLFACVGGDILTMDRAGRPLLARHKAAVGFSHTKKAAFCAIAPNQPRNFAIDAECAAAGGIKEIKAWTRLEACGKALGVGLAAADPAYRPLLAGLFHIHLAVPGHIVCGASNTPFVGGVCFRWLHYSRLV